MNAGASRRRRLKALPFLVAAPALLVACGSTKATSSASTATGATSGTIAASSGTASCAGVPAPCSTTVSTATGTPITIGVTTIEKDPIGDFTDAAYGAQAAVSYVNGHGGIQGHPIKAIVCPMLSTSGGAQCANEFVADKVVAVIEGLSTLDSEIFPILSAANIPVIGGAPITPVDFVNNHDHWQFAGGPLSELFGSFDYAVNTLHVKSMTVVMPASPSAQTEISEAKQAFARYNFTNYKTLIAPGTTADPTPTLVQVNADHPDAIFFGYQPPTCATVMKDIKQVGVTAKTMYFSNCGIDQVLSAAGSAAEGVYISGDQINPVWDPSDPEGKVMKAALEATGHQSSLSDSITDLGFQATMNVAEALDKIGANATSTQINQYFETSNSVPSWLGVPFSCGSPPFPTLDPALCSSAVKLLQVQNGALNLIGGGAWYS